MRTLFMALLAALIVGCSQANSPPERQEKQAGVEQAAKAAKPKQCSDFQSPQDIYAIENELTAADKKSLDPNNNGIYCDEPGTDFKTEGGTGGVPKYTYTYAPGRIPDVKDITVVIDTPAKHPYKLELIGEEIVEQYGPDSLEGNRIMWLTYRDAQTYEDYEFALYFASREDARTWNAWLESLDPKKRDEQFAAAMAHVNPEAVPPEGGLQLMGFSFSAYTASPMPEE